MLQGISSAVDANVVAMVTGVQQHDREDATADAALLPRKHEVVRHAFRS
jgi:hypothetical protein